MSTAKERRLVVATFTKRAVAETPLITSPTVPGPKVAPAVSGVIPKGKGKKVSATPQIHTASFNGDVASALSAHLEKIGAGWTPPKPYEPYKQPGWTPPKPHDPYQGAATPGTTPGAIPPIKPIAPAPKAAPATKGTVAPSPLGLPAKAAADDKTKEMKPLTADEPAKKAPEKKPEEKESENAVEKKAAIPGIAPPPDPMGAPPAGPEGAPEGAPQGGGIDIQKLLAQLGEGLGTIGSKSMSGVGSAMGAMGMPGAQDQLNMWSQDPGISKGVGGGVSALGAILAAYLLRRLMAGGGEGMEQAAGLQCQDMLKQAGPFRSPLNVMDLIPTIAGGLVNPKPTAPQINPKMLSALQEAEKTMSSLPGYQGAQGATNIHQGLIGGAAANSTNPAIRAAGNRLNREAPKIDNQLNSAGLNAQTLKPLATPTAPASTGAASLAGPSAGGVGGIANSKALTQGVSRAQAGMNTAAPKPTAIPSMPQTMSPPPMIR